MVLPLAPSDRWLWLSAVSRNMRSHVRMRPKRMLNRWFRVNAPRGPGPGGLLYSCCVTAVVTIAVAATAIAPVAARAGIFVLGMDISLLIPSSEPGSG